RRGAAADADERRQTGGQRKFEDVSLRMTHGWSLLWRLKLVPPPGQTSRGFPQSTSPRGSRKFLTGDDRRDDHAFARRHSEARRSSSIGLERPPTISARAIFQACCTIQESERSRRRASAPISARMCLGK